MSDFGGALHGVRVVELGSGRQRLCGRILADLGADVIMVEDTDGPPESDRAMARQDGKVIDVDRLWFDANKRSMAFSASSVGGRARVEQLITMADVVVEGRDGIDGRWSWLDYGALRKSNGRLIWCSLSGLGLSGPYCSFAAPDIVATAMSGLLSIFGEPDQPPLWWPYDFGDQMAAVTGAMGILGALRVQRASNQGQLVEISTQEVLAGIQHLVANYSVNSEIVGRTGSRSPVGGIAAPQGPYACSDGFVYMSVIWVSHWKNLVRWMGSPEGLVDGIFETRHVRDENREFIDEYVAPFVRGRPKQELFLEGQKEGTFIAPINSVAEFVHDAHVEASGFFTPERLPSFGNRPFPGMPFKMNATPLVYRRSAPAVGENSASVEQEMSVLLRRSRSALGNGLPGLPFSGVRVLDFTHAVAGPTVTRLLGEQGAEVIKVESHKHFQRGRVSQEREILYRQQIGTFADLNRGKLSLTLDMSKPRARDLARRLTQRCDVVVNNFTPRVMQAWGLDYDSISSQTRRLIVVDMPGYGLSGPYREFLSGAVIVQSLSGAFSVWDYEDGTTPAAPASWYADYGAGVLAGCAIAAALLHRDRTGFGQHIEQSQLEATAWFLGPAYLEYLITGRDPEANGVYAKFASPYGPYECLGQDAWCVIAVETDEEWDRLVGAMGSPEWARNPRLSSKRGRVETRALINEGLARWTREQTPMQVTRRLQAIGIPAGPVMTAEDVFHDPHLRSRGYFVPVNDKAIGTCEYPGSPIRYELSTCTPGSVSEFGQHNRYVLRTILGLDESEIDGLAQDGVLG